MNNCSLCGEPMPESETMFKFHGYSGPCPKPPLQKAPRQKETDEALLSECLSVLEFATYHDGRYDQQHNTERFLNPAQSLVKKIADRLGVEMYAGFGS